MIQSKADFAGFLGLWTYQALVPERIFITAWKNNMACQTFSALSQKRIM